MKPKLLDNKKYFVYKHTAPNNKVYIGITHLDPKYRWMNGLGYKTQRVFFNAIVKYGWINFKHEILFNDLTEEEALNKEEELIKKYKTYDKRYGYNISLKGPIYGENLNKKIKKKEILKQPKFSHLGNVVLKKDNNNNIIQKYSSVNAASRDLKMPEETLRCRLNRYKILYYDDFYLCYEEKGPLPKIEMLTLNGDFIKLFDTIADAYNFLNRRGDGKISSVCRNKRNSYLGFKWRYKYED